jgi:hypothetical protein
MSETALSYNSKPIQQENPIELSEKSRTYHFPKGDKLTFEQVTELIVRESGTHRLKTADGKLHIIPVGWLGITIDESEWTV